MALAATVAPWLVGFGLVFILIVLVAVLITQGDAINGEPFQRLILTVAVCLVGFAVLLK